MDEDFDDNDVNEDIDDNEDNDDNDEMEVIYNSIANDLVNILNNYKNTTLNNLDNKLNNYYKTELSYFGELLKKGNSVNSILETPKKKGSYLQNDYTNKFEKDNLLEKLNKW